MARGRAARGLAGGGDRIPALGAQAPRVGAVVICAAVAAGPALGADRRLVPVAALGAAALALLALAVAARRAGALPWSLGLLAAEYAVWLSERGASVDARAPVYAVGLLVVAELSWWSVEPPAGRLDRALAGRRILVLLALAVGTVALGTLLLAAAAVPAGGGAALDAVGVAAAVALLALVVRLLGGERAR